MGAAESGSPVTSWRAGCLFVVLAAACGRGPQPEVVSASHEPPDARVKALADTYLSAYFDRYPDQATYFGVPNRRHDQLPDNSLTAQKAWEAREDGWLAEARSMTVDSIQSAPLRATYAITR